MDRDSTLPPEAPPSDLFATTHLRWCPTHGPAQSVIVSLDRPRAAKPDGYACWYEVRGERFDARNVVYGHDPIQTLSLTLAVIRSELAHIDEHTGTKGRLTRPDSDDVLDLDVLFAFASAR